VLGVRQRLECVLVHRGARCTPIFVESVKYSIAFVLISMFAMVATMVVRSQVRINDVINIFIFLD
jgi:hypothetical protein